MEDKKFDVIKFETFRDGKLFDTKYEVKRILEGGEGWVSSLLTADEFLELKKNINGVI